MEPYFRITSGRLRLHPIAAALASLVALSPPASAIDTGALSTPLLNSSSSKQALFRRHQERALRAAPSPSIFAAGVLSCGDDPADFTTLRHAVLTANSKDTIDLSKLNCSTITLQHGAISVIVDDLTILGPGADKLTIDGNQADRVFKHDGIGTLTLQDITVAHGVVSADQAYGGCIYSKGSLALDDATLTACKALGQTGAVGGGAVVGGTLTMHDSVLSDNLAFAAIGGGKGNTSAIGGGAFAESQTETTTLIGSVVSGNVVQSPTGLAEGGGIAAFALSAKYSTVTGNQAVGFGNADNYSGAGGFLVLYSLFLANSTVDHNTADVAGAGVLSNGFATILQSTISSNIGNLAIGGLDVGVDTSIANSTIAFNTGGAFGGGGILVTSSNTLTLQSTIVADNIPNDIDGSLSITGANNIVKIAGPNAPMLPMGTITLDPVLGPLDYNGGRTRTHLLNPGSPAINAGSNVTNAASDQRGGTYKRQFGAQPDIGAVEMDPDHIFGDKFGLD